MCGVRSVKSVRRVCEECEECEEWRVDVCDSQLQLSRALVRLLLSHLHTFVMSVLAVITEVVFPTDQPLLTALCVYGEGGGSAVSVCVCV